MNRLFATGTVTIDAAPDRVFEVISDPAVMARLGEEIVSAEWVGGAARAALGARFAGHNRKGRRRWTTLCTVVELEPGRRFVYDVHAPPPLGVPIARWGYEIEPAEDGACTVTEKNWARVPVWFVPFAMLITGTIHRPRLNSANITTTLDRLKAHVEDGAA
ncbi:SRPBCC family protein [Actinomadura sediminis]|uniref:SRPBCC family protein n=1 Tax=Actinomadura sediminis TaxID=1038904 RepID=A0ABW3EJC7_9ACTN